jgi:excisionase family DNA binding protein
MTTETPTVPRQLASLEETAAYTNVPESTLRQLAREGRLPGARKIGRRWRVRLASLDAWMDSSTRDPD